MDNTDTVNSPGHSDSTPALLTTSGSALDTCETTPGVPSTGSLESGVKNLALGHQSAYKAGGIDINLRVLVCEHVDLSVDYEGLHLIMKKFGDVERMRLKLSDNKLHFLCYVKFTSSVAAHAASKALNGHNLNNSVLITKLFNVKNLNDEPFDFIPKVKEDYNPDECVRTPPIPIWYVATYKDGQENIIRAAESIESKVGAIPIGNFKRYGKSVLIKAGNESQAILLSRYQSPQNGNIKNISPHRSFNTMMGVVYSKDLHYFDEQEILQRCPQTVCRVKKLGGNAAILLTFSCNYLPDYILVGHERMSVRKYKQNPKQCHNCLEYGHGQAYCKNKRRCAVCSEEHEESKACSVPKYCYHCEGNHSPTSRECSRYKFEQEVLMVANNEHISIGAAKHRVIGANRNVSSTYASAVKVMKTKTVQTAAQTKNGGSKNIPVAHKNVEATKLHPPQIKTTADIHISKPTTSRQPPSERRRNSIHSIPLHSKNKDLMDFEITSSQESLPSLPGTNRNQANLMLNESLNLHSSVRKRNRSDSPAGANLQIEVSNPFSILQDPQILNKKATTDKLVLNKSNNNVSNPDSIHLYENPSRKPSTGTKSKKPGLDSHKKNKLVKENFIKENSPQVKSNSGKNKS